MTKTLLSAAVLAAVIGSTAAPAQAAPYVSVAPPPLREEVVPPPRHGWVWTPGYWNWNGHRYVWVAGTWVRERPGWHYAEPRWVEHDDHWVMERGRWAHGDRDHDGVPNEVDHHPDNPYRR